MRHDVTPSGFFVARSPLLPLEVLVALGEGLESSRDPCDEAVARDVARVASRVRELVARPDVREALFVASPSLDAARAAWLVDPASGRAAGFVPAALRYLARMTARATPFGLFSGCALGTLGDVTSLDPGAATLRRATRLDMHYLVALTQALEGDPSLAEALTFEPSTGLVEAADTLRYAEARVDPVTRERALHLVAVARNEHLDATLRRARGGARLAHLADALVADGIPRDEADAYLRELVGAQLLTSSLEPPLTGRDPLDAVLRALDDASRVDVAGAALAAEVRDVLRDARDALDRLDREGVGAAPARYTEVAQGLARLPVEADMARLFQVDLFRDAPGFALGPSEARLVEEALAAAVAVHRAPEGDPDLRAFREAFVARYGLREVPLGEALDEERGVGFPVGAASDAPSPLLAGLTFPATGDAAHACTARDRFLLRRLEELARTGAREWELRDDDLRALGGRDGADPLPDAFAVFGRFLRADDGGEAPWFHVEAVTGPSGANLLGRFCQADPRLASAVAEHLADEEALRPDALFAELVHLPEGRAGNVLCRPVLRSHEIPLYGRSGAPRARQIELSDLLLSVRGDALVLRSRALDRDVVPCMTTAHNAEATALGAYRFLCALQREGGGAVGWSWGLAGEVAARLPRVRLGRVVLSPARWTIPAHEARAVATGTLAQRYRAMQALRARLELPRMVGVGVGDHVLPVDLDNPCLVDAAAALFREGDVCLVEALGVAASALTAGPHGTFAHELVVPFTRTRPRPPRPAPPPAVTSRRVYAPGSEWLYARVECGAATADAVLAGVVRPLVDEAAALGCDRWFFLRYEDPAPHLRLRFRGDPAMLCATLLPRLHDALAPWLAEGRVARVTLDTYDRELERYGGDAGIALAEEFFHLDSELTLGLVERFRGDDGADARWRLALFAMHTLTGLFVPDAEEALAMIRDARRGFAAEVGGARALDIQLGKRFRAERSALEALCAHGPTDALADAAEVFEAALPRLRDLAARFREAPLTAPPAAIVQSYLHMHVNRALRSMQRTQEFVLYDFLARIRESARATGRLVR